MDVRVTCVTGLPASEVDVMNILLYITSNIIHVYAIYIFLDSFLGVSKLSRNISLLTYAVYFLISTYAWLITGEPLLNIAINIISPLLISLQYENYILKKFFGAVSSCAVCMFTDWAAVTFAGRYVISESGLLQGIAVLILSSLFRHYTCNRSELPFRSKYSWFLIFTAAGTILIGLLTVNDSSRHDSLIVMVLLCINFLNFYIYNNEQTQWETNNRLKIIETLNGYYKDQLTVMSESQEKMRFLRHDFRKHLNKLRELSCHCSNKALQDYLCELEGAITESKEFSKTGNNDIDCLMNYELTLASESGTAINYKADIPPELNISSFDITIILGNLMDNAVYALKNTSERILIVSMIYNKGVIRIDIENTFDPSFKRKNDGQEHGIGLLSVKNSLQKYNGKLSYSHKGDRYRTTVVMYDSVE